MEIFDTNKTLLEYILLSKNPATKTMINNDPGGSRGG
jgi:hypothetical protein